MLYGSDMHRVFHSWWTNAGAGYVPFHDGCLADILTLYYDPLLDYHHRVGLGGGLSLAFQLVPQARNEARAGCLRRPQKRWAGQEQAPSGKSPEILPAKLLRRREHSWASR